MPLGSQEIKLEDFYVSPDLTFISGTTENTHACTLGDVLWIHSPYYPEDLPQRVTSQETVKRNGYILVPKALQVFRGKTTNTNVNESGGLVQSDYDPFITLRYVEYNGNTYFAKASGDTGVWLFEIDGEPYTYYSGDTPFLTIKTKVYIENDKVTVDGITYNAVINKNYNELFLTDSIGNPYSYSWDASNVTYDSKWVSKLVIGENIPKTIDYRRVTEYGHKPYIIYDGEKIYLENFYGESGQTISAGVTIGEGSNQKQYIFRDYTDDTDNHGSIYDITSYINEEDSLATMPIGDDIYEIFFEPCDIANSGIIGIETTEEHLPILIGDTLVIHTMESSPQIRIQYDGEDRFVYLNGRRYNVINNLCDSVMIGGVECELSYDGKFESFTETGMTASCLTADGTTLYFQVTEVEQGKARKVKRRIINGDGWIDAYAMNRTSGGTVEYSAASAYTVYNYDGVRLGDYNAKVLHYEYVYNVNPQKPEEAVLVSYDYIEANSSVQYKLTVVSTVGSNMILCKPDVSATDYDSSAYDGLVAEILMSVETNRYVIEKRTNSFGTIDLYSDSWLYDAGIVTTVNSGTPISVYDLAGVEQNIRVINKNTYLSLPLRLYRDISQKLEYDDLILTEYYKEEEDMAINKLVDMDKDMYSPVFHERVNGSDVVIPIDKMVFNLHFRTRDMETWKIIEDGGVYVTEGDVEHQLSANHDYCNWFITDYYPFYDYAREYSCEGEVEDDCGTWNGVFQPNKFKDVITRSDLLGFLYFTTDDVRVAREKLRKSFLRLTFFDSINPETQNMLGTSTLYFDCNRYLDLINEEESHYHYEECVSSRNPNRSGCVPLFYCYSASEDSEKVVDGDGKCDKDGPYTAAGTAGSIKVTFENGSTLSGTTTIDGDDIIYTSSNHKMRMPTPTELNELITGTTHSWVNINGVNGMKFINENDSTKYIFIPAAGIYHKKTLSNQNEYGYIWSNSRLLSDPKLAVYLSFGAHSCSSLNMPRYEGLNLRGVAPSGYTGTDVVDLGLSVKWAKYNLGANTETESGLFYQWGDTQGYSNTTLAHSFDWPYYKWWQNGNITKYNINDGKVILDLKLEKSVTLNIQYRDENNVPREFVLPMYNENEQTPTWQAGDTLYFKLAVNQSLGKHWQVADEPRDDAMWANYNRPTVLTQAFALNGSNTVVKKAVQHMYMGDDNVVLDSRITVTDRYSSTNSSEGFDTYILKTFANKKEPQTIYMKAEFFHAGLGIKIPMVIPTTVSGSSYDAISEWTEDKYKDFKRGYDLNSVFKRLYIPIQIEYSKQLKKFVYSISDTNNYLNAIKKDNTWQFNLFELKIKPQ